MVSTNDFCCCYFLYCLEQLGEMVIIKLNDKVNLFMLPLIFLLFWFSGFILMDALENTFICCIYGGIIVMMVMGFLTTKKQGYIWVIDGSQQRR